MILLWGIGVESRWTPGVQASPPPGGNVTLYLPLVAKNYVAGFGTVSGVVVDAQSGIPIEAQVCMDAHCIQTNANGFYQFLNIASGYQIFEAQRSGFTPLQQGVAVVTGQNTTLNFALSPLLAEGELRIIVTWGTTQQWCTQTAQGEKCVDNDLDAHLWVPQSGGYEHIYWDQRGNCDSEPFACLENDVHKGSGPETMLILPVQYGSYKFAVHNYADAYDDVFGVPELAPHFPQSGAVVRVYDSRGLAATFTVPSSGQGLWWYVFNLNKVTGLEEVNILTDTSPENYMP